MSFFNLITAIPYILRGRRSRGHVIVGFTTTYAISVYHH